MIQISSLQQVNLMSAEFAVSFPILAEAKAESGLRRAPRLTSRAIRRDFDVSLIESPRRTQSPTSLRWVSNRKPWPFAEHWPRAEKIGQAQEGFVGWHLPFAADCLVQPIRNQLDLQACTGFLLRSYSQWEDHMPSPRGLSLEHCQHPTC
jgi:hypothetical protein